MHRATILYIFTLLIMINISYVHSFQYPILCSHLNVHSFSNILQNMYKWQMGSLVRTVSHILLRGKRNFIVGTVIVMYVIVQLRTVKFGEITVRLHMHHPIGEGKGRGLNNKVKVVRCRHRPHRGLQQSRGLHHPPLPHHLLRHQ